MMINAIKSLFGSGAADKVASAVYDGADAAWFTDEEKARHAIKLLEAYHPFKKAQRWLMLIIMIPFVGLHVIGLIYGFLVAPLMGDLAVTMQTSAREMMQLHNDNLFVPASIVVGFYLGGGVVDSIKRKGGGQ